jgi:cellulose synthase/poly-beta-1,6-N-acetylglucosamine synthase-like glycosyltransferase
MDADHVHVKPNALKKMIPYFNRPEVMCVSPMMAVYKPKGIWQRVQHIEYMFGIFLRKAFASVNAIHVTPGAFSAYRRNLFKKIGGFEARNITEDLEMSLRIQLHHYVIENSTEATIFTTAPKSFKELALQRRRWNSGLLKNLWAYRKLFSAKYGVLGILVLPIAIFVIMASLILSAFFLIRPFQEISRKLFLMNSINYNVFSSFEFKWYVLQNYLLTALTDPAGIFSIFFFMILIGHIIFAKRKINELSGLGFSLILFLIFYTFLFAFWWIISFFYVGFRKNISWR